MNLPLKLLENAAREGRLTHLLLFHGGSRLERREMALKLAQILNCRKTDISGPCSECISCRKIRSENHPDVFRLEPIKASIGIEQVLAWQERIYRKHYEGNYKVSLIEQAESLTIPAANALLKVVEEPPERTVIILSAENAEGLLPTIQSRAQIVYFSAASEESWLNRFEQEKREEAREAFYLAGKNADLAAEILKYGIIPLKEWIHKFREVVKAKSFIKLFELFPIDKEQALLYLQVMANLAQNSQNSPMPAREILAIGKAIDAIRQQVNPRLAVEVLALQLFQQGGKSSG